MGLADTSKVTIKEKIEGTAVAKGKNKGSDVYQEKEIHKVQILDPATGTGTFLSETVKQIYKKFKGQEGLWSDYIENHLIPRLNGFEILMASYAMCHLKLEMLLQETGYKPKNKNKPKRLNVFLTNALEEAHPDTGTLFASWLSKEASEANRVKSNTPVMVVIGNPPYSGESQNKGEWIMNLMDDYKKEPGGKVKLKERNPKWINDDYVKFLRYGQHFIEKNGEGILAFINPHGYLDNPTFRGMRWHLLKTYDKIYVLDLHGNSKKKEVCPDGSPDLNVFDIQQGVSINIMIKTNNKKKNELGKVFHYDLYGKRDIKYEYLWNNNIKTIEYKELENKSPMYYMVEKDFELLNKYDKGFKINDIIQLYSLGIQTHRDKFAISDNKEILIRKMNDFFDEKIDNENIINKYELKETNSWKLNSVRNNKFDNDNIKFIDYRPFDTRYIYYSDDVIDRSRKKNNA